MTSTTSHPQALTQVHSAILMASGVALIALGAAQLINLSAMLTVLWTSLWGGAGFLAGGQMKPTSVSAYGVLAVGVLVAVAAVAFRQAQ